MAEKYLTNNPGASIDEAVVLLDASSALIVTDANVDRLVMPILDESNIVKTSSKVVITPGEAGKNLDTVVKIWDALEKSGATRKSVVINIGGVMVTDIGGFAASTFKRGIATINFPTTFLGVVDAATGGKTGINFNGFKNEIGTFHEPAKVIISPLPFSTLPQNELLSGYAEMMKTALISDHELYVKLYRISDILSNSQELGEAVEKCVNIKEEIVKLDPKEEGLRKVLNFGHTAGHAFESIRLERGEPVTHGEAVAHGMLVALILSNIILDFPSIELNYYHAFLKENYPRPMIGCNDIPDVLRRMANDKKNSRQGEPSCTLLRQIGEPVVDCHPTLKLIRESLEIYRDLTG